MENLPLLPLIALDLKKSTEAPDFSAILTGLRESIGSDSYDSRLTDGIAKLSKLRQIAVSPTLDFNGVNAVKEYYGQLHLISLRINMSKHSNAYILFKWMDSFSSRIKEKGGVRLEKCANLYNLAALHSILAKQAAEEGSEDRLKISCMHYQYAAGVVAYARDNVRCRKSNNVSSEMLQFYTELFLAHAQELLVYKAFRDKRKPRLLAKIAYQVVEYYRAVLEILDREEVGDLGAKKYPEWFDLCVNRTSFFLAVSYVFLGMSYDESEQYGDALFAYETAKNYTKSLPKPKKKKSSREEPDAYTFLIDFVQNKFDVSKRDNDFIYHEKVPVSLPDIKAQNLVTAFPFSPYEESVCGPDLFPSAIPLEAVSATSLYSEKKDSLMRDILDEVEAKDTELEQFVQSLGLDTIQFPDLEAHDLNLPEAIIQRCAQLSLRPSLPTELEDDLKKLNALIRNVDETLCQVSDKLESETRKNDDLYSQYGVKRPAHILGELSKEFETHRSWHISSEKTNKLLRTVVSENIDNLKLMNQPLSEIKKTLPTIADIEADEEAVSRMKVLVAKENEMVYQRKRSEGPYSEITKTLSRNSLIGQFYNIPFRGVIRDGVPGTKTLPTIAEIEVDEEAVSRMKVLIAKKNEMVDQRKRLLAELRSHLDQDDITVKLSAHPERSSQQEIYDQELKKHDAKVAVIRQNLVAQENIISAIVECHAKFALVRRAFSDLSERWEVKISALITSYDSCMDMKMKLDEFIEMYQEVSDSLLKLRDRVLSVSRIEQEERNKLIAARNQPKPESKPTGISPKDGPAETLAMDPEFLKMLTPDERKLLETMSHEEINSLQVGSGSEEPKPSPVRGPFQRPSLPPAMPSAPTETSVTGASPFNPALDRDLMNSLSPAERKLLGLPSAPGSQSLAQLMADMRLPDVVPGPQIPAQGNQNATGNPYLPVKRLPRNQMHHASPPASLTNVPYGGSYSTGGPGSFNEGEGPLSLESAFPRNNLSNPSTMGVSSQGFSSASFQQYAGNARMPGQNLHRMLSEGAIHHAGQQTAQNVPPHAHWYPSSSSQSMPPPPVHQVNAPQPDHHYAYASSHMNRTDGGVQSVQVQWATGYSQPNFNNAVSQYQYPPTHVTGQTAAPQPVQNSVQDSRWSTQQNAQYQPISYPNQTSGQAPSTWQKPPAVTPAGYSQNVSGGAEACRSQQSQPSQSQYRTPEYQNYPAQQMCGHTQQPIYQLPPTDYSTPRDDSMRSNQWTALGNHSQIPVHNYDVQYHTSLAYTYSQTSDQEKGRQSANEPHQTTVGQQYQTSVGQQYQDSAGPQYRNLSQNNGYCSINQYQQYEKQANNSVAPTGDYRSAPQENPVPQDGQYTNQGGQWTQSPVQHVIDAQKQANLNSQPVDDAFRNYDPSKPMDTKVLSSLMKQNPTFMQQQPPAATPPQQNPQGPPVNHTAPQNHQQMYNQSVYYPNSSSAYDSRENHQQFECSSVSEAAMSNPQLGSPHVGANPYQHFQSPAPRTQRDASTQIQGQSISQGPQQGTPDRDTTQQYSFPAQVSAGYSSNQTYTPQAPASESSPEVVKPAVGASAQAPPSNPTEATVHSQSDHKATDSIATTTQDRETGTTRPGRLVNAPTISNGAVSPTAVCPHPSQPVQPSNAPSSNPKPVPPAQNAAKTGQKRSPVAVQTQKMSPRKVLEKKICPVPKCEPYAHPAELDKLVSSLDREEKHILNLSKKTLSGPTVLDRQWKDLEAAFGREWNHLKTSDDSANLVTGSETRRTSRYDHNCARLSDGTGIAGAYEVDCDQINIPRFIVVPCPSPDDVVNLWKFVDEKRATLMVSILGGDEISAYLPQQKGLNVDYDSFMLCLQNTCTSQHWLQRNIIITNKKTNFTRSIVQLQFLDWPDGVDSVANPASFLSFIRTVRHYASLQTNLETPVVVQCRDGFTRSGFFLLMLRVLQSLDHGLGLVDIGKEVTNLRQFHQALITSSDQLFSAYLAQLHHAQQLIGARRGGSSGTAHHVVVGSDGVARLQPVSRQSSIHSQPESEPMSADDKETNHASSLVSDAINIVESTEKNEPGIQKLLDPEAFEIGQAGAKPQKQIIDFDNPKSRIGQTVDPNDPFSSLDPLWKLK